MNNLKGATIFRVLFQPYSGWAFSFGTVHGCAPPPPQNVSMMKLGTVIPSLK